MRPKALVAGAIAAAALGMAVPTFATAHANRGLRLVMGGRVLHKGGNGLAAIAGGSGSVIVHQGFSCGVVVGQGPGDTTFVPRHTHGSSEFYLPFGGGADATVTTTCIGKLPPGTPHDTNEPVSHVTANCGQINPLDPTKFISGFGVTITFPSGLFAETCVTSDFTL